MRDRIPALGLPRFAATAVLIINLVFRQVGMGTMTTEEDRPAGEELALAAQGFEKSAPDGGRSSGRNTLLPGCQEFSVHTGPFQVMTQKIFSRTLTCPVNMELGLDAGHGVRTRPLPLSLLHRAPRCMLR